MSTGDEQQSAGGVVPRQRWRRGLAAAVAVTGASVLAVTIAWQGQSHDPGATQRTLRSHRQTG